MAAANARPGTTDLQDPERAGPSSHRGAVGSTPMVREALKRDALRLRGRSGSIPP
jgi:hypothetical protein